MAVQSTLLSNAMLDEAKLPNIRFFEVDELLV